MAIDPETKRLADWKVAAKKYSDLLEKMVDELGHNTEVVPSTEALKDLAKKSIEIERASKSFRDDVNRAEKSAPKPPEKEPDYTF
jgi:hypothetical protein